jgi:uncharacterized membrane protein YeaQ/YmgE (transglycosylase-associated protein family)
MNPKSLVWIGVFVGSAIGGWIPSFWGVGGLSFSSIIGSTIGGLAGIWAGFKLSQML